MKQNLHPLTDGLWAAEHPLSLLGISFFTRMVVIRLSNGGLVLHSPVPPGPVAQDVGALGPVRWRIAPNRYHHLFQQPWADLCPDSRLLAAPGLEVKRPDLVLHATLSDTAPPDWTDELLPVPVAGNPTMAETVFLHVPSRSLILSDLMVQIPQDAGLALRLYGWLNGLQRPGVSWALRRMYRDRTAARRSIDRLLALDFDRVIPAHGPIIETGGRAALEAAFRWLK